MTHRQTDTSDDNDDVHVDDVHVDDNDDVLDHHDLIDLYPQLVHTP